MQETLKRSISRIMRRFQLNLKSQKNTNSEEQDIKT